MVDPLLHIDPLGLRVYLCHRKADLPFPMNLASHYWVKTDSKEAGMGANCPNPGQQCSDAPLTETKIIDSSGQSDAAGVECEPQNNVDEKCVNDRLIIGTPTGRWGPWNQCQSFAYGTVNACRTGPQIPPQE